ncbi:MAG: UDP-N-acetylmuramate dehydrogenase [Gillisia sp.]
MKVLRDASLKPYNTFGIDVKASRLISVESVEDLKLLLKRNYAEELFILGGGSNMLFTHDLHSTVLQINLRGKEVVDEDEDHVYIKANAGENWHQFVLWTLDNGWGGLENLSLIPGNVGTSPIQNIGAYGVEIKDRFVSCEAIDIQTLEVLNFTAEDCEFGYRNSIFKNRAKGKYIVTSVIFRLSKKNHQLITNYGTIEEWLREKEIENPGIKDISNAVIAIRSSKLPDPKKLGNSGSFFKNPVLSEKTFSAISQEFPEMPFYSVGEGKVKVPAGWLIEHAGLKGYREGDAGVHAKQALVLVNYGNASGLQLLQLAQKVQETVFKKFKIELEPEVNIF